MLYTECIYDKPKETHCHAWKNEKHHNKNYKIIVGIVMLHINTFQGSTKPVA